MANNADLNINDLVQLRGIIELSAQRGAFQAAELSTVGAAYDKLTRFLAQLEQRAQEAESQGDTE